MRILHAPENIGGMAGVLAKAQSALGYKARSYCPRPNHFKFPSDYTLKNPYSLAEKLIAALRFSWEFDIFQFYFGNSLLDDSLLDLLPLSFLRKRVFFYFCGCDIRDEKHTTLNYETSACANCFPKLCNRNRNKAKAAAEKYGRVNFVSTPDLLEYLPRSVLLPQVIDLELINNILREPVPPRNNNRFIIGHAPTNRKIKGTHYLLSTVQHLQKQGYPIDILLIENKSHEDALRAYRSVDLAVDQLLIGSYGLLAAELMALGIPTVVYLRSDLIKYYVEMPPLINADPANLENVILNHFNHRDRLTYYQIAGPIYARNIHDPKRLALRCLEAYEG